MVRLALLIALLGFHFVANLWYLRVDNHVIRTDEETHMLTARQYYDTFVLQDHDNLLTALTAMAGIPPSNPAHPPLLPMLGAALAGLFGYSVDAFALVNTFLVLALLLGCLAISRRFLDPWSALFATFVVSFTPSVFHASRFFMTDYPAAAIVVWSVYALLRSDGFRHLGWVMLFGLLTGLGILTRTVTFLYYLIPAAVVFVSGLLGAWRSRAEQGEAGRPWRLFLHGVVAVAMSAVVFTPWYFHNLEQFYHYWVYEHAGGTGGPLTVSLETSGQPAPAAAQPAPSAPPAAEPAPLNGAAIQLAGPVAAPAERRASWRDRLRGLIERRQPGTRYLVHIVNNNLFLPLSMLALAGILLVPCMRRFRSFPAVMLLLWAIGGCALMTLLIKYSVARYALPVAPALGMLAALPVLALPRRTWRAAAMIVLAAYLGFVYGNLTFASYGAAARLYVPLYPDAGIQKGYDDPGLAVFKDTLTYGFSFSGLGPAARETYRPGDAVNTVQECNFQARLLRAMARQERHRKVLTGQYANYQRLGREMRGMELIERHFWPPPNPYLDRSLAPEDLPARRLRSVRMAITTEDLVAKLPQTDYVAYAVVASDEARELAWQRFLKERGFELVERFTIERFGCVPARIYGVMARTETAVITIDSTDDIDGLNLFELYDLKSSHQFPRLRPDMQDYTVRRFVELLQKQNYPPLQQINEALTYIGAEVAEIHDGEFRFWFIFQVSQPIEKDWRVFLHGRVTSEYLHFLPEEKRTQGYEDWNFNPDPPTSGWPVGDYVIITRTIMPAPIPYSFKLGFFTREDGDFGRGVNVGMVDFSQYTDQ